MYPDCYHFHDISLHLYLKFDCGLHSFFNLLKETLFFAIRELKCKFCSKNHGNENQNQRARGEETVHAVCWVCTLVWDMFCSVQPQCNMCLLAKNTGRFQYGENYVAFLLTQKSSTGCDRCLLYRSRKHSLVRVDAFLIKFL